MYNCLWENSGGLYTAFVRPLYGHCTDIVPFWKSNCTTFEFNVVYYYIRPLYSLYMAFLEKIIGPFRVQFSLYKAIIRPLYGHYAAVMQPLYQLI